MTVQGDAGLRFERQGAVAILTLDRPGAGNSLNLELSRTLMNAAIACDTDESIRAVLLRSEGKMFCAGGDVPEFGAAGEGLTSLILEETAYLHSAVSRLARMEKPLVTAIQGFAAGAGISLAMLGDIAIAGRAAQFTLAYTGIAFSPDVGASWLLPRLVGLRRAQEMILLNTRLTAEQALAEGLVTRVVDDAELDAEALAVAQKLAQGPTKAYARVRELLLSSYGASLEGHLEHEARAIARCGATHDGPEGVAAFLGKRPPSFEGR